MDRNSTHHPSVGNNNCIKTKQGEGSPVKCSKNDFMVQTIPRKFRVTDREYCNSTRGAVEPRYRIPTAGGDKIHATESRKCIMGSESGEV